MTERRWRAVLGPLGAGYLALGVWAAAHPASFRLVLANFGPQNDHLVRDFGACAVTFGLGLLVARRLPHWRTAALTLAAVWNGCHAVSHVVDVRHAEPAVVGPVEAVLLTVVAVVLALLARLSATAVPRGGDR